MPAPTGPHRLLPGLICLKVGIWVKESSRTQPRKVPDLPPSWMLPAQVWERPFHVRKFRHLSLPALVGLLCLPPHPQPLNELRRRFCSPSTCETRSSHTIQPGRALSGGDPLPQSDARAQSQEKGAFCQADAGQTRATASSPPLPLSRARVGSPSSPSPQDTLRVCCRGWKGLRAHCGQRRPWAGQLWVQHWVLESHREVSGSFMSP